MKGGCASRRSQLPHPVAIVGKLESRQEPPARRLSSFRRGTGAAAELRALEIAEVEVTALFMLRTNSGAVSERL